MTSSEILEKVLAVAEAIDRSDDNYSAAIRQYRTYVDDPEATPSARIIQELETTSASFFELALETARRHRDYFASIEPLSESRAQVLADEATASCKRQRDIEAADDISLDEYVERYFQAC